MTVKTSALAILGIAAATCAPVSPASARNAIVKQDYPSGPNVYRVEIRNLNRLEVLETGDSDGIGELHELIVQLSSYNPEFRTQSDGKKYSGKELYLINKGGIVSGNRNMPIRVGQHVFTKTNRRPSNETQMWVHAYSNPADRDFNSSYHGGVSVNLEIFALELDCAGQRVCRRNSKGSTTISFKIPEFSTPPPNRCGPSNTFRLEKLDGELQISGLSDTRVNSRAHAVPVGAAWWLLTKHKKGGPRLQPFNADICIASTSVSGTQAAVAAGSRARESRVGARRPRSRGSTARARGSTARTDTTELRRSGGNIPPVANDDSRVMARCNTSHQGLTGNDTDADGNVPLSIVPGSLRGPSWVTHSATHPNSHVSIVAPNVTATRPFTVQYTVQDTLGATDTGTLTVDVRAFGPTC